MARRHCIEDESSNNRSRIVGQTRPISHSASLVTTCAQPSPTIVQSSRRPGSIVCPFFASPLPLRQVLNVQPGPQPGHSFFTSCLNGYVVQASGPLKLARYSRLQSSVRQRQHRPALDDTLQALRHSGPAILAKSWVPFLHLIPQLGSKFPLRCCSKRRWTRSAPAGMQMRAFWHGICLSSLSTCSAMHLCHSPVLPRL